MTTSDFETIKCLESLAGSNDGLWPAALAIDVLRMLRSQTKRYWLFGKEEAYYASGGMADFLGWYDTLEQAKAAGEGDWSRKTYPEYSDNPYIKMEWFHIFDIQEKKVVYQKNQAHHQSRMCESIDDVPPLLEIELPRGLY